jgi:hypothetical protein
VSDVLASLSAADVAGFYRRLAFDVRKRSPDGRSLASELLLHWLDGHGAQKIFDAGHVKDVSFVRAYLREEVRPTLLTQKKAEVKPMAKWAGIMPRIARMPGFEKLPGVATGGPYPMMYEGPSVEVPLSVQIRAAMGGGDPREVDLLYALHKFGLVTNVVAAASPIPGTSKWNVRFDQWRSKVRDEYDWDPTKKISVPNPDYKSNDPKAVTPSEDKVTVYHSNAKRIERAGLAAPYHLESGEWQVNDQAISGPAVVDTSKCRVVGGTVECG